MTRSTWNAVPVAVVLTILALGLLLATPRAAAQSGGGYDLTWSTIDGGGVTFSTGGTYSLSGTIGQPDAGRMSGGDYVLAGGFWSGAGNPTAVTLSGFWVEARGGVLIIFWETATELDTMGFSLYRSDTGAAGSFTCLNDELISSQAPGSPTGASYEWIDAGVEPGQTYFYLLEDVDIHGQATPHGPVAATLPPLAPHRAYLPLLTR